MYLLQLALSKSCFDFERKRSRVFHQIVGENKKWAEMKYPPIQISAKRMDTKLSKRLILRQNFYFISAYLLAVTVQIKNL